MHVSPRPSHRTVWERGGNESSLPLLFHRSCLKVPADSVIVLWSRLSCNIDSLNREETYQSHAIFSLSRNNNIVGNTAYIYVGICASQDAATPRSSAHLKFKWPTRRLQKRSILHKQIDFKSRYMYCIHQALMLSLSLTIERKQCRAYVPSLSSCRISFVRWKLISSRSCSSIVGGLPRAAEPPAKLAISSLSISLLSRSIILSLRHAPVTYQSFRRSPPSGADMHTYNDRLLLHWLLMRDGARTRLLLLLLLALIAIIISGTTPWWFFASSARKTHITRRQRDTHTRGGWWRAARVERVGEQERDSRRLLCQVMSIFPRLRSRRSRCCKYALRARIREWWSGAKIRFGNWAWRGYL